MVITRKKLQQYLLGELPESEIQEIDILIISEPEFSENLSMAEDDLIEDYLDGMLTEEESRLFQRNFLTSRERQSQLEHLSLLKNYARKNARKKHLNPSPDRHPGNFLKLLKYFTGGSFRPAAVAAIFIVLGVVIGIFIYNSGEGELTALNRKNLTGLENYKNYSSFYLIPESFRDSSRGNRTNADQLTGQILFRLALLDGMSSDAFYNIEIIRDLETVATLRNIRSYTDSDGPELRFLLPSSILKRGIYQIRATPENMRESPIVYTITLQ